jgi:CxxC motif-containing protein (DUF1111 family)
MMRPHYSTALIFAVAMIAGCADSRPGGAPGPLVDGGPGVDGGVPVDAGADVANDVSNDVGGPGIDISDLLPPAEATGGALTSSAEDWRFLELAEDLSIEQVQRFSQGRELFMADWTSSPGSRPIIDGLGPIFNAVSCAGCHPTTGRAPTLGPDGQVYQSLLVRLRRPATDGWAPDPVFGGQFQPLSVAGVASEGRVTWQVDERGAPSFSVYIDEAYGALHPDTRTVGRASPHLVGMGLLDLVADETILEREDPDDSNGDGISGRAYRLDDGRIGRFGWKANQPSLRLQAASAFAADMGITTEEFPRGSCTEHQQDCLASPNGGEPEVSRESLTALVNYLRHLGVPAARRDAPREVLEAGARHFRAAGCGGCHRPKLTTPELPDLPLLSEQEFYAFTDLLLHDMGPGLAAEVGEGNAAGSEWRTPPLWGLGLVEALEPEARFLHDGRAKTLHEAILWHGGEAAAARRYVERLGTDELDALLTFVRSL